MAERRKLLVAMSEAGADVSNALRRQGYEIVVATDAVAVLTMALRHKPDAVVLADRLAAGGTNLALRRLRSSVHTAGIPVIALAEPGPVKQALLAAGVEACLDLPLDSAELFRALHELLLVSRTVSGAPAEILGDPGRLAALERTGLLDSAEDEEFDTVTRLAARLLHAPVALVSLVDDQRQFFKSQIGLPQPWDQQRQTPLSHSFCQWVVSSDQELAISDAREHPILRTNGAIFDLGVVAYAGVPLSAATGETIGSFCAIDGKPRNWTSDELATLRDLGQIIGVCSALNHFRQDGRSLGAHDSVFLPVARSAAMAFVGAARLLSRHGDIAEVRAALIGLIERRGHDLIDFADAAAPASQRSAA